jgi:hypothetical protein
LKTITAHIGGKRFVAVAFYHLYAGWPIGTQYKTDCFGKKVIVFFTLFYVGEIFTIRTTLNVLAHTAFPDFAPTCFFVSSTSRAFAFDI